MLYQKRSYVLMLFALFLLTEGCGLQRQSALSRKLFVKTGHSENKDYIFDRTKNEHKSSEYAYVASTTKNVEQDGLLILGEDKNVVPINLSTTPKTIQKKTAIEKADKTIVSSTKQFTNRHKTTKNEKADSDKRTKVFSILGMSLSIVSIFLIVGGLLFFFAFSGITWLAFLFSGLAIGFAILGVILCALALKNNIKENKNKKENKRYKLFSIVGIILSGIVLLSFLILLIIGIGLFSGWWGGGGSIGPMI